MIIYELSEDTLVKLKIYKNNNIHFKLKVELRKLLINYIFY